MGKIWIDQIVIRTHRLGDCVQAQFVCSCFLLHPRGCCFHGFASQVMHVGVLLAWLSKMTELATCILERCGSGNPHFDMIDGRPGPDKRRGWPT